MSTVLTGRALVACTACGWVHYEMTPAEKAIHDSRLTPYDLSPAERETYETGFQQCLRCESSSRQFRPATDDEIARAIDHLVTPILLQDAVAEP